jgi:hypothetical protein
MLCPWDVLHYAGSDPSSFSLKPGSDNSFNSKKPTVTPTEP